MSLSPPGDIRPAFDVDYKILWETLDQQYGTEVGFAVFPPSKIVLLNRIGGLDRMEEVILDGYIVGILNYNIITSAYEFWPKVIGGQLIYLAQCIKGKIDKKRIWVNEEGAKYNALGRSILAPGVESVSEDIALNDHCLVLLKDINSQISPNIESGLCIAIGMARAESQLIKGMIIEKHGQVAKNKDHLETCSMPEDWKRIISVYVLSAGSSDVKLDEPSKIHNQIIQTLSKAYAANRAYIQMKVEQSMNFIQHTINDIKKPVAVAYSGGKDSLATLILVSRVLGTQFKIFFADTGLELPEVIENVSLVARALGMESKLVVKSAQDKFWQLAESFGPPGRDYRFCCHTLKAQQIMEIITELYQGERVLVFLGQRQFESFTRAQSNMVYTNSFIPLQIAATPIKHWNALLLWLFLLYVPVVPHDIKEPISVPINPLYFQGHERLGCFMCPASNLNSIELLKKTHNGLYSKWMDFLQKYAKKYNLPPEWIKLGLWRFKRLGPQWQNLIKELGLKIEYFNKLEDSELDLLITKGYSPCLQSGFSIKGRISQALDLEHLTGFICCFTSKFNWEEELNVCSISDKINGETYRLNIFSDGSFFLQTQKKEFPYIEVMKFFLASVFRAKYCNICQTCVKICPQKAISVENGVINISSDLCKSCNLCITHCPLYVKVKMKMEKLF